MSNSSYGRYIWTGVTVVSTLLYIHAMEFHHKWGALWGSISVLLFGVILAGIIGFIFFCSEWFSNTYEQADSSMLLIVVIVIALALGGGIFFTEPVETGGHITLSGGRVLLPEDPDFAQLRYEYSRAGYSFTGMFYGEPRYNQAALRATNNAIRVVVRPVEALLSAPCSGKGCNGKIAVFLVIIGVLVVIGCWTVPHFWAAGALIFLTIAWMITIREWYLYRQGVSE